MPRVSERAEELAALQLYAMWHFIRHRDSCKKAILESLLSCTLLTIPNQLLRNVFSLFSSMKILHHCDTSMNAPPFQRLLSGAMRSSQTFRKIDSVSLREYQGLDLLASWERLTRARYSIALMVRPNILSISSLLLLFGG